MNKIEELLHFENIREQQKEAFEFFLKSDKKFIILEMPTGSGKSGVGIAIGKTCKNLIESSYLLTSQKVLQDQYSKDFGKKDGFAVIKGAKNYTCPLNNLDVKNGLCLPNPILKKKCSEDKICPYIEALKEVKKSKIGNTNYSYFFYVNEQGCYPVLGKRKILICDECHNIEKEVMNYISFTVSKKDLTLCGIEVGKIPDSEIQEDYVRYFSSIYKRIQFRKESLMGKKQKILSKYITKSQLKDILDSENAYEKLKNINYRDGDKEKIIEFEKDIDFIDKVGVKIDKFVSKYSKEKWLWNIERNSKGEVSDIEFKPITISYITDDVLFSYGEKIVLMSSTILNKKQYCESLGIDLEDVDFLSMGSEFPVENRKVYGLNVGKLNYKMLEKNLPKVLSVIEEIIKSKDGKKGIIHTQSYKIAKYIEENIDSKLKRKLLFHGPGETNLALQKHQFSKESILVTPSMFEGVDLVGDLSRFQIIIKLPFPFLGDKWIVEKSNEQDGYFEYEMIKKFIQTCGRSIRNKDDYCDTYVLDSSFSYYFKKFKDFFPKWFKESVEFVK